MLRAELQELIRNGESSGVEFKRDEVSNQDLAKEVARARCDVRGLDAGAVL